MTKFDARQFLNDLLSSTSSQFYSTRLKRMATAASLFTVVAVLTVFCLFVQSGRGSSPDDDDLQRVHRSLLGVPAQSLVQRFNLAQTQIQNPTEAEVPGSNLEQSDIFISVKTTKQFHQKRLDVILKTWFQLARDETWFFTDAADEEYHEKTGKLILVSTV